MQRKPFTIVDPTNKFLLPSFVSLLGVSASTPNRAETAAKPPANATAEQKAAFEEAVKKTSPPMSSSGH